MTHYQIDDLLIRFVGMSKVKASGLKFVCTTNTYDRDFEEYLARGYRIDLVNPFVVQDGEVIEKDLSDYKKIKKVLLAIQPIKIMTKIIEIELTQIK